MTTEAAIAIQAAGARNPAPDDTSSASPWIPPQSHNLAGMDSAAAQRAMKDLTADRNFSAAFAKGDPAARGHWQELMNRGYSTAAPVDSTNPAAVAADAKAQLAQLQKNPAWLDRYLKGGIEEKATFKRLTEAAAAVSADAAANAGADINAYRDVKISLQPDDDIAVIGKIQTALRESFHEAGIPPILSQAIVGHVEATAARVSQMDDRQYDDYAAQSEQEMRREWGENYQRNLDMVEAVLQRMKTHHAFIGEVLAESGTNKSPWLLKTLYNLAAHQGVKTS